MNKQELMAIQTIAKKMDWQQQPMNDVIEKVNQMVTNQQVLELDTLGVCDDYSKTLLFISSLDKCRLESALYVSDYNTLCDWSYSQQL